VYKECRNEKFKNLIKRLAEFDRDLEIIATPGTASFIEEKCGLVCARPSIQPLGDLVKSLDYKILVGLLLDKQNPKHNEYARQNDIKIIDAAIVLIYPFGETEITTKRKYIDVGGPAAITACLKAKKPIIVSESQYDLFDPSKWDIKQMHEQAAKKLAQYYTDLYKTITHATDWQKW